MISLSDAEQLVMERQWCDFGSVLSAMAATVGEGCWYMYDIVGSTSGTSTGTRTVVQHCCTRYSTIHITRRAKTTY